MLGIAIAPMNNSMYIGIATNSPIIAQPIVDPKSIVRSPLLTTTTTINILGVFSQEDKLNFALKYIYIHETSKKVGFFQYFQYNNVIVLALLS